MTTHFANKQDIKKWNHHLINNPDGGNIFASREFAEQKETGGYKARYIWVDSLAITALQKDTPIGKLWYLPKGPGVKSVDDLDKVVKKLSKFAKSQGVFAIKVESELDISNRKALQNLGYVKVSPIIPNPSTITLDISPNLDKVLSDLPQKGRHAIRRAERDGVTIKSVPSTDENCQIMYRLLADTAKGQFGIRSYEYYRTFWQRFESSKLGQLFFAYFEGQIVAGAYAMVLDKKSTYKDGASVRERTAYGASHLLQWEVIKWAKSKGSELHDFCGSPPSESINDPTHRHYGVGQFKKAFNKNVTDYIGCYDFVINPVRYKIWSSVGERLAHRLHYYKNHDSYY